MKKILFIDRDGTLIHEPPDTFQIDSFEKLRFLPGAFYYLRKICEELKYSLVMVTNQDGLGTDSFPEETFWPVQDFIIRSLEGEKIFFEEVCIDRTFEKDNLPRRKPNTGMLTKYMQGEYDLSNSFVIGDRITDIKLAQNLGTKSIFIRNYDKVDGWENKIEKVVDTWEEIYNFLKSPGRIAVHERNTNETKIRIDLNLDGAGESSVETGIPFFNHMLDQLSRHGNIDLKISAKGDLEIDEHHTIEDTAITLGETFAKALGDKRGMERYGFCLPMDDCLAQVAVDFGGRPWCVWEAEFKREKIGEMPTEMFFHFFKSFSDGAKCNLNIKAEGTNEHHKIEAIFKAFAKAIKMAVKRDVGNDKLPTTKGTL
ncbi:MAG: bifunctional histidinol-phosphatase/imidazoleglycerol-phosphate dehydratase HisB [Bacteroidota bacterium]|nr:bifunctional histidinol-phosphatase/imidazoleglycerol-phosphate dehydratase HisB [Bacteroidota bacterium]